MSEDPIDLQIKLGDLKTREGVADRAWPTNDPAAYTERYGQPDSTSSAIYIRESALRGIEEHTKSSYNEVGGLLIGGVYSSNGRSYVRIEDFIPAQSAAERKTKLTFTHDTWSQLNSQREQRWPHLRVVGWYHSHPGLGVFLSDDDRFIHRNFFNDDSMVAYVVDPVDSDRAFFKWSEQKLIKSAGFYVFSDLWRKDFVRSLVNELQKAPDRVPREKRNVSLPDVKIVFSEPCINLYDVLPRYLRRLLGIMNSQTAPRISVKSLIILVLACLVTYQCGVLRAKPSIEPSCSDNVPKKSIKVPSNSESVQRQGR